MHLVVRNEKCDVKRVLAGIHRARARESGEVFTREPNHARMLAFYSLDACRATPQSKPAAPPCPSPFRTCPFSGRAGHTYALQAGRQRRQKSEP